MDVIFVKEYIDLDTYSSPVVIKEGDVGVLLDEVTGRVLFSEGYDIPIELEGIPSSRYVPVKDDSEE